MNERIEELWQEAVDATFTDNSKSAHEKFAELILKDAFMIIKEAMIDTESTKRVDEVIADRLADAACDVCDKFDLLGPIYEG